MTEVAGEMLFERWKRGGRLPVVGRRVLAAWREPHRAYHTIEHLAHMLEILDQDPQARVAASTLDGAAVEALELACWYHDIVYDPRRDDNEARSAERFLDDAVQLRIAPPIVQTVVELILLSATHKPVDGDLLQQLFCDLDLAIFGDDAVRYKAYREGIRKEYGHIDGSRFALGRAAVLEGMLRRPQLYSILLDREGLARKNVTAELNAISGPRIPSFVTGVAGALRKRQQAATMRAIRQRSEFHWLPSDPVTDVELAGQVEPTPGGFRRHGDGGPNDEILWQSIVRVEAYKRGFDTICLRIGTDQNRYAFTEEDPVWNWLVRELPRHLPVPPHTEWWPQVAFPPFETCFTTLFELDRVESH